MNLEEFLEEQITSFEQKVIQKNPWTKEEIKFMKSKIANSLTYIAGLLFPEEKKKIEKYLKQKGYDPYLGKQIENIERVIIKARYEQEPELN